VDGHGTMDFLAFLFTDERFKFRGTCKGQKVFFTSEVVTAVNEENICSYTYS
jgi:hypothetical protein